jgi:hypothetical protein
MLNFHPAVDNTENTATFVKPTQQHTHAMSHTTTTTKATMTMNIVRPSRVGEDIANSMMDKTNWKLPTEALTFAPSVHHLLLETADALDFFLGGHEVKWDGDTATLSSKGYYHYIGA